MNKKKLVLAIGKAGVGAIISFLLAQPMGNSRLDLLPEAKPRKLRTGHMRLS